MMPYDASFLIAHAGVAIVLKAGVFVLFVGAIILYSVVSFRSHSAG